jgi:uncharacterized protein YndB with AHSA1/START domain
MERSTVHDTFVFDRHYATAPGRVFRAFADPAAKAKWFGAPGAVIEDVSYDFREGGRETATTIFDTGMRIGFTATYSDIVPDERIVYTYEMTMDGRRISVSVATVELRAAAGGGTGRGLTEPGVYLDGLDQPKTRLHGTEQLLDNLGAWLETAEA